MPTKLFYIQICLLFSSFYLQSQLYETTRYADDNGLPSRIVRSVIQDKNGFIWVAGNNGLFKFDGRDFKSFYASLKDTVGLRNNRINTILQTSDEKIWVGTPKGLHVLENGNISYVKLMDNSSVEQEHIVNLFEDKNKNLWVGTYGGLFVIDSSNKPIHFLPDERRSSFVEAVVWGVTEDSSGKLWFAADGGLFVSDNDFEFKQVAVSYDDSINLDEITFFKFHHYNDSLVIITSNKGLFKGNIGVNQLISVTPFLDENEVAVSDYFIEDLIIDSNKNIWIGTQKNKFKKYSIVNGHLHEQKVISKNGLLGMAGDVKSIYEDKQGNIWLSNVNGLYKLTENVNKISTFPPRYIQDCSDNLHGIYGMVEDKGGHMWVSTATQLYRFNKSDLILGNCPEDFLLFENKNMQLARDLFIDSQYRLWIGADNGLFVAQLDANHNPGKFTRFTTEDGLPHNWSYAIYEEDKNNFWVANYLGLAKITLTKGNLNKPIIKVYQHIKDEPESLVNTQINSIEVDKENHLWFGTFSGVSKLLSENDTGTFKNYTNIYNDFESLSNNSIKKIFRDSNNRLWIATQRGLNLYDFKEDKFIQLGYAEGLPSEYILGIDEDSKGQLWILTTNGVLKCTYNEDEQMFDEIEHYTSQNGLADNIPYRNSILIDSVDNVFIGSRDGISIFKTDIQKKENKNFNIVLTQFENSKKNKQNFQSSISRIHHDEELELKYYENSIKLTYALLDYAKPEHNKYRHKFLPIDEEWKETGALSELSYYNLSPGDYELVLDGTTANGIWSKSPIHLKFIIAPPIWKSLWSFVFYILLVAGVLRFFYLLRIRGKEKELKQKMALKTALVNEREVLRKENSADFHDELGSMLTKISLFLELAERNVDDKVDAKPFFKKIRENIKGLSGGFRDLLWVIDPQKDNVDDTFLRLKEFGEDLFNNSNIDFRVTGIDSNFSEYFFNPQVKKQVVMIFKEAMNNCLKYSESNKVVLKILANDEFVDMWLIDNGKGFNIEVKGKGRGLKNMKERTQKINAKFIIDSNENGTKVHLSRIPHMSDT